MYIMALQVWLPLNGNLNNQGLSNVTISSSGTSNSNGKIGQCYACKSGNYVSFSSDFGTAPEFTIAFWVKVPQTITTAAAWQTMINFPSVNDTSNTSCTINWASYNQMKIFDDSNHQHAWITLAYDTWIHYAITNRWDGTNNYIDVYQNGIKYGSYTSSKALKIRGGTWYLGSGINATYGPIYYNDVRIYDHCLSPKEVHSISQALVLHYSLDDMSSESTTNLATYSADYHNKTYGSTFNISGWGGDVGTCTCYATGGYNNGPYKVYHKTATGSGGIYVKMSDDITIVAGKTYTFSAYVKASREYTDSVYSFNINRGSDNYYITANSAVHFTTDWQLVSRTFTATDAQAGNYGEMSIIYNDDVTDYYVYYSCFQIEEGDHPTPYVYGTRNGQMFDESGYQNDGTISGKIQIVNSEIRYRKCGLFNGSSNNIISSINGYNTTYTFVVWAKFNKFSVHLLDCRNSNEVGYQPMYVSNGGVQAGGSATGFPTINYSFSTNTWYHIAVIYSTNKCILYVNGNKIGEAASGYGYNYETNLTIHLGSRLNNTNWFSGNISDFRIYATALSAADIKSLYNIGAVIDNGANMHTYEYHEIESTTPKVHRTGVTDSSAIIEPDTITNASFSKAGIIKSRQFYEV